MLKNATLAPEGESLLIQPTVVVHLTSKANYSHCQNDICHMKASLANLGRSACISNFICSVLNDNPCGDFGLELTYSQGKTQDVCFVGELHRETLNASASLEVDLWYGKAKKKDISCFFWCTKDGHLPKPPQNLVDKSFLLKLVSILPHHHVQ